MSFSIASYLNDTMNIIEIYLGSSGGNNDTNENRFDIYITDDYLNKIRRRFKLTKETTLIYFNRNNLSYVYDLSNDSQFVYLRKLENFTNTKINNRSLYTITFNEMKIQTHSFACTNDIDSRVEYKMEEFKINNRISLIIKNNNLYISYKHSKDVDLEKIDEIINNVIKKIL